ncbi:MAG: ABC transporter substrate-binding protein [Chloroflexota bacterium]
MFSSKAFAFVAAGVIGVTVIACGRGTVPNPAIQKYGGSVTEAVITNAVAIQPLLTSDSASTGFNTMVYAPLLKFNTNVELQGELAEGYTVAADGSRITMTLRPGAQWSDGTPITSADVVFTWEKMMDPAVRFPYRALYDGIFSAIQGPDASTVVFSLKDQCGPALITAGGFTPIPKHIFESVDINENPHNFNPPVASGPWRLQEWVKDSHAVFVANDRYWAGRPNLDSYVLKTVPDSTAGYTQFRTGEVDVADIEPAQFEDTLRLPHANAFRYFTVGAAWDYIGFNLRDGRFQDVRVRRAFSHAIDRSRMIDTIRQGFSKPQYSIFPVTSPVFSDDVARYDFDPDRARQLLSEAGWVVGSGGLFEKSGEPFEVRLFSNTGNKRREQIATRTQEYLRQVGVKANIIIEEFGALSNRVNKANDFDLAVMGWVAGVDPNGQSNIWKKGSPQNGAGYDNPAVERLFQQGAAACSMDERRPHYQQIQQILAEDAPYIFLWTNESAVGVNKRVEGPAPGPLTLRWNATEWSIN